MNIGHSDLKENARKHYDSFRKLRGVISDERSFREMVEDAIFEKYNKYLLWQSKQ